VQSEPSSNRDQSWNLRFDFVPTRMGETTIQRRPFDDKPERDAAEPPSPRPSRRPPAPEPATAAHPASTAQSGGRAVTPTGRYLFLVRYSTRRSFVIPADRKSLLHDGQAARLVRIGARIGRALLSAFGASR